MTRWAVEKTFVTQDQERLQRIEIYSPDENKESVKREQGEYSYTRLLLLTEKDKTSPRYILAKTTKAGKGN